MTQVSLVLLFGYVLGSTRQVRRLLVKAAPPPETPVQTYAEVTFATRVASLLSWGLGLMVGVLLAPGARAAGT